MMEPAKERMRNNVSETLDPACAGRVVASGNSAPLTRDRQRIRARTRIELATTSSNEWKRHPTASRHSKNRFNERMMAEIPVVRTEPISCSTQIREQSFECRPAFKHSPFIISPANSPTDRTSFRSTPIAKEATVEQLRVRGCLPQFHAG